MESVKTRALKEGVASEASRYVVLRARFIRGQSDMSSKGKRSALYVLI